jgi:hypothetical protein
MALILKPHVEKQVIDTFKPPVKPVVEAKVIEGFKPPPRVSYESIADIQGEEKVVAAKTIRVGKLNSIHESDSAPSVTEVGLKKQPIVSDMFKPKPIERVVNKIVIVPRPIEVVPVEEEIIAPPPPIKRKKPVVLNMFKPAEQRIQPEIIEDELIPRTKSLSFKELINTVEKSISAEKDRNIIKPKYIKDTSVFYKKSSYLKDLLGEK